MIEYTQYQSSSENNYYITKSSAIFCYLFTLIFCMVELTPYLSRNLPGTIKLGIFILWFFSTICIDMKCFRRPLFLFPVLIAFYQLVLYMLGMSNITILVLVDQWRLLFIPACSYIILMKMPYRYCRSLFSSILFIFLLNLISNVYLYSTQIVSNTVSVGDVTLGAAARLTNAGDTSFVFITSLLILLSIMFFAEIKDSKIKIVSILIVLLSVWYLFFLNSRAISIMLLLFAVSVFLMYLYVTKRNRIGKSIRLFLAIAICVFLLLNITSILSLLGKVKGNDWMSEKMTSLISLLSGQGVGTHGSLYARFRLYGYSISTFLSSPINFIMGIGKKTYESASISTLSSLGISGHSDVFDLAAQYGIIGIALFSKYYISFISYVKSTADSKKAKFYTILVYSVVFAYGILNHIFYGNVLCICCLLFPLFVKVFTKSEMKEVYHG